MNTSRALPGSGDGHRLRTRSALAAMKPGWLKKCRSLTSVGGPRSRARRRGGSRGTAGSRSSRRWRTSPAPARWYAVGLHLGDGVREPGLRSCGCPSRAAARCLLREGFRECGQQLAVLLVDRRDAAEVVVVLGDVQQPLVGDVAAGGDMPQERHHLVRGLRSTEDRAAGNRRTPSGAARWLRSHDRAVSVVVVVVVAHAVDQGEEAADDGAAAR